MSNLLDLWPAIVAILFPIPLGVAAGFAVDAWLVLRQLRRGETVDR